MLPAVRCNVVFSQVSVGNAETRLFNGNFSTGFRNVNVVKSLTYVLTASTLGIW